MPKNILVFMDGTRNKPSDPRLLTNTNVWKLYEASADTHAGREHVVKYVRGVGTGRDAAVESPADDLRLHRIREWNPPGRVAKRIVRQVIDLPKRMALKYGASAVGWGVADRIREGYAFLSRHYEPGDRVYLFGFSRGAFEARSLAGFVDAVGLLLRDKARGPDARRLVDKAYEIYRRGDEASFEFLRTFLRRMVRIAAPGPATDFQPASSVVLHFVGVWDTVEALAIGELEAPGRTIRNRDLPVVRRHTTHHLARFLPKNVKHGRHALAMHELRHKFEPLLWDEPLAGQQIEQCWFAGAHADIGGGYPQGLALSNIALRWMADHATTLSAATSTPILFGGLPAPGLSVALRPHHEVQGDFFWATPSPRATLLNFATLAPGVAATLSVHPSTVARLFDAASTRYDDYPYDKEYRWTEWLPQGTQYPQTVAAALGWLDDRIAGIHLAGVLSEDARSGGPNPAGLGPSVSAALRQPAWRAVHSVAELRLAQDTVEDTRARLRRATLRVDALRNAFGVLVAFDHDAPLERLVHTAVARAARLTRVAQKYPQLELRIRARWVDRFADLCAASDLRGGAAPAQALARIHPLHAALCRASETLRSHLSYPAPMPAEIARRPPAPPSARDAT